jgi:sulfite reductase alpha subunit-like flavoprotein
MYFSIIQVLFMLSSLDKFTIPVRLIFFISISIHRYCDFQSVPRASALKNMTFYVSDPVQKARLKAYANDPEQKKQFNTDMKSWLEVLEEFPALALPFDVFLHMVPKLSPYPRYYTIASSAKLHPRTAHITVTWGPTKLPNGREYNGICSTYVTKLETKQSVSAFVRPSSFRLPKDLKKPVIMFGPGTGVAPFRAFWQEARFLANQGTVVSDWHLFFGCRYEAKDYLYREEMAELKSLGIHLHVAFSRDRKEKTYVQDLLKDEKLGSEIWNLIKNRGGHIYVCGASAMGRSVKEAVVTLGVRHGNLSQSDSEIFVKQMADVKKTYIQEIWS